MVFTLFPSSVGRCPFPFELDISHITKGFFGVGLVGHALVAVLVLPTGEQRQGLITVSVKDLASVNRNSV